MKPPSFLLTQTTEITHMKITSFNLETMHTLSCIMRATFPADFAIHREPIQAIERGSFNGDMNAITAIHFPAVSIHRRLIILHDGTELVGWAFNHSATIQAMDSAYYRSMNYPFRGKKDVDS